MQAASAKHEAATAEVRRPGKVGDEQRDVKKVAAQLFRAFDEGRLREPHQIPETPDVHHLLPHNLNVSMLPCIPDALRPLNMLSCISEFCCITAKLNQCAPDQFIRQLCDLPRLSDQCQQCALVNDVLVHFFCCAYQVKCCMAKSHFAMRYTTQLCWCELLPCL